MFSILSPGPALLQMWIALHPDWLHVMISCVQHAMVFVALTAKSGCTAFWTAGQRQATLTELYQIALQTVSGNKSQCLDADAVSAHKSAITVCGP